MCPLPDARQARSEDLMPSGTKQRPYFAKPVGAGPTAVDENKLGQNAKLLRAAPITSAGGG
jgi:hypothetical protein